MRVIYNVGVTKCHSMLSKYINVENYVESVDNSDTKPLKRRQNAVFVGEFEHTVDTKGRIFVPVKFRDELGSAIYISCSFSGCVTVYTEKSWNELSEKILSALPAINGEAAKRSIFRRTQSAEIDSGGRILLTSKVREHANIGKNAVIVGMGDRIEIWSAEKYEQLVDEENIDDIKTLFANYGL